ncbi:hypothetical protein HQ520_04615 [bacterium]|nr:hypothetical protein [bacterium]
MWWHVKNLFRRILLLDPEFLCDTCKYDYPRACTRPERPNAMRCPDYRKGGK